jgi:hypothetical protein
MGSLGEKAVGILTAISSIPPEKGALTTLHCATQPADVLKTATYYVPYGEKGTISKYGMDDDLAKTLWEKTESVLKETLSKTTYDFFRKA